jgi:hypothetical protein
MRFCFDKEDPVLTEAPRRLEQQLARGISEAVARDFIQFTEGLITWLGQKMK